MSNTTLDALASKKTVDLIYMLIGIKIEVVIIEIISKSFFFYQPLKIGNNIIFVTVKRYSNTDIENLICSKVVYYLNCNNLARIFVLPIIMPIH